MATVLYITAHPLDTEASYSLSVGKEFVEAYRAENQNDEVVHLDLYKTDLPQIDADVLNGWFKLRNGEAFDNLTSAEKAKVSRLGELVDQFVAADKYVFVNPVWNFSYPPAMKAYIDAICVAGKHLNMWRIKDQLDCLQAKKPSIFKRAGAFYPKAHFKLALK